LWLLFQSESKAQSYEKYCLFVWRFDWLPSQTVFCGSRREKKRTNWTRNIAYLLNLWKYSISIIRGAGVGRLGDIPWDGVVISPRLDWLWWGRIFSKVTRTGLGSRLVKNWKVRWAHVLNFVRWHCLFTGLLWLLFKVFPRCYKVGSVGSAANVKTLRFCHDFFFKFPMRSRMPFGVCARNESYQLKRLLICQVLSFFLYRIRIKRSNKVFKEANGRRKKYNSPCLCFFFRLSSSLRGAHDFPKRELNLSKTYWFLLISAFLYFISFVLKEE